MTDDQNKAQSPSFSLAVPEGDDRKRLVCDSCGHVQYVNPKVVVGSVPRWEDRFLLCRRAIPPRKGFWTLPAGYLEEHETTEAGARREAREEACADIAIEALLAVYNITHLSQVQLIYRARLVMPEIAPGPESTEVGLFRREEIPWEELAFPSVVWALTHEREAAGLGVFAPFTNPGGATGLSFPERPAD
ncbi:MAG: NUDIX domain-containing protein [Alphaproteobacteria bacterium]